MVDWDTIVEWGQDGDTVNPRSLRDFVRDVDEGRLSESVLVRFNGVGQWMSLQDAFERLLKEFPDFWLASEKLRPVYLENVNSTPAAEPAPSPRQSFGCPFCGSENTAKASVIYSQGTTTSYQPPTAHYIDENAHCLRSVGGGTATHSTDLARQLAPPGGCALGCLWPTFIIIAGFVFVFSGDFVASLILGAIGLVSIIVVYHVFVRGPQMRKYRRTWYCYRCGSTYEK